MRKTYEAYLRISKINLFLFSAYFCLISFMLLIFIRRPISKTGLPLAFYVFMSLCVLSLIMRIVMFFLSKKGQVPIIVRIVLILLLLTSILGILSYGVDVFYDWMEEKIRSRNHISGPKNRRK